MGPFYKERICSLLDWALFQKETGVEKCKKAATSALPIKQVENLPSVSSPDFVFRGLWKEAMTVGLYTYFKHNWATQRCLMAYVGNERQDQTSLEITCMLSKQDAWTRLCGPSPFSILKDFAF